MKEKEKKIINGGVIERAWKYSPEPRLEGLLKASQYLNWKNVKSFDDLKK